jgi:hypothetical protein
MSEIGDEFIRKILDIAPCVGVETGFCRAHDQRVSDCEEYFEYKSKRVRGLLVDSGIINFREHQRGFQEGWHDAMLFGHSSEWTDLRKAIKELMKRHGAELEEIQNA